MADIGYIQVTRLCNQNCIICSNPPGKDWIEKETAEKLIRGMHEKGMYGVFLTGGEPTLYPDLPQLIAYTVELGLEPRIITNGQVLADMDYAKTLYNAGLRHIHLSIYSCRPRVQAQISLKEDSLENALKTLANLGELGMTVDINTAISHFNADHLDETVVCIIRRFPFVRHFVWDFLDPLDNRASQHPETIPTLWEPEIGLNRAMRYLEHTGRTFRIERYPACYMAEYAWASTEIRKAVNNETRETYFLDQRGHVLQAAWKYGKTEVCRDCTLNDLCPGLWDMDKHYASAEVFPVFVSRDNIVSKVLEARD